MRIAAEGGARLAGGAGDRGRPAIRPTQVKAALQGLDVHLRRTIPISPTAFPPRVRTGIAALRIRRSTAVIVRSATCRASPPALIDRLIAAFGPDGGALIVRADLRGKRGNPVLWARRFFADLKVLSGDSGARQILKNHADGVVEVPVADDSSSLDVDTPEVLASLSGSEP